MLSQPPCFAGIVSAAGALVAFSGCVWFVGLSFGSTFGEGLLWVLDELSMVFWMGGQLFTFVLFVKAGLYGGTVREDQDATS